MARRRSRVRGFTLVELMTVVIIIGVLSLLATVGFGRMKRSSHVADGQRLVQAVRLAQETYHAEVGRYANISSSLAHNGSNSASLYPEYSPGKAVNNWGSDCGSACNTGVSWSTIPMHNEGITRWGVSTVAGAATAALPTGVKVNGTDIPWPDPTVTGNDWFVATAMADLNANSDWITVVGSSFSNAIAVDGDSGN
ncbi:MAG: prepilin-type N-terminal cleavage/methylation domain-containing protein [Polyangiaceae bacterium]